MPFESKKAKLVLIEDEWNMLQRVKKMHSKQRDKLPRLKDHVLEGCSRNFHVCHGLRGGLPKTTSSVDFSFFMHNRPGRNRHKFE